MHQSISPKQGSPKGFAVQSKGNGGFFLNGPCTTVAFLIELTNGLQREFDGSFGSQWRGTLTPPWRHFQLSKNWLSK